MKVAFIHPDLGIGGAERLVVDAALALKSQKHEVVIYTSHHDPHHAFDETVDGTLTVQVRGNTIFPRNISGKFSILCAILRQLHLARCLVRENEDVDLFIVDQLSACVPVLRTHFPNARILFYCHHPDLVLTERQTLLKTIYRYPFDWFEKWSTSQSDQIAVNSLYTKKVFEQTFKSSETVMRDPTVVYPVVDANVKPVNEKLLDGTAIAKLHDLANFSQPNDPRIFLSINRFERKKDIRLILMAFSMLMHAYEKHRDNVLIVAGGYDHRVLENVEYLKELEKMCAQFRLPFKTITSGDKWNQVDFARVRVLFLPSVDSQLKNYLLEHAALLAYTPTNEHFGIVPLEGMIHQTPVLATNTGGCLETIVDGETGWLREADITEWYKVLVKVVQMPSNDLQSMGEKGRKRVQENFSMQNMVADLGQLARKTKNIERKQRDEEVRLQRIHYVWIAILLAFVLAVILALFAVYLVVQIYEVTKKL